MDALNASVASPAPSPDVGTVPGQSDFSVHGVLGVRLIDPGPADAASIAGQLGVRAGRPFAEPDIVVKFVDRLPPVTCSVGSSGPGVDSDGRLVVDCGEHRAALGLHEDGQTCRIVCERGIESIPLLEPIANLIAMEKGYAALHSSAFVYRGRTVLAIGWAQGGKTTALLAFGEHGAGYVSDDRVWVRGDGDQVLGFSTNIVPEQWQFEQLSALSAGRTARRRIALQLTRSLEALPASRRTPWLSKAIRKGARSIGSRLAPRIRPERLFDTVAPGPVSRPATVFVMLRHDAPDVVVRPLRHRSLVRRAWLSARHDRRELLEHYDALRFVRPTEANLHLEAADRLHKQILDSALRGTQAYLVRHPHRISLAELYASMEPFV